MAVPSVVESAACCFYRASNSNYYDRPRSCENRRFQEVGFLGRRELGELGFGVAHRWRVGNVGGRWAQSVAGVGGQFHPPTSQWRRVEVDKMQTTSSGDYVVIQYKGKQRIVSYCVTASTAKVDEGLN
jgi:hypothetical protein